MFVCVGGRGGGKGSVLRILLQVTLCFTAAGAVPCGGRKTSPIIIVEIIYFDPLGSLRAFRINLKR